MTTHGLNSASTVAEQAEFLTLLPAIRNHAHLAFRNLPDADREEAVADAIALAWQAYRRLKARGKQPALFRIALARFAVLGVCNGRHVGRRTSSRDVLARLAQRRRSFRVHSLESPATGCRDWGRDALVDGRTPVPQQAAFNLDFNAWLYNLPPLRQKVTALLAQGFATNEVASMFKVSSSRISQLRRELATDWCRFHGEPVACP
jgi:DNA-directed RNA polymerase specialized sigma24 family protein